MNSRIRHIKAARTQGTSQRPVESGDGNGHARSEDIRKVVDNAYTLLQRRRWLIVFIFLMIMGVAAVYVSMSESEFEAQSILVIEEQKYDPSDALSYGHISGLDNSTTNMHLLVLSQSTALAQRVAQRVLSLKHLPDSEEPISLIEQGITKKELAKRIQQRHISITSSAPNVINIKAEGPTGREAAFLANLFAEEAIAQSRETSRHRVAASRQFLEKRIEEGRQALEVAEDDLQQYLRREGAVALDQEVQVAVSNLARIEAAQSEALIELEMRQASLLSTEAELTKIRPMLTQRVASGVDREIASSQQRLAELELRLEQIFSTYARLRENPDDSPGVVSLQEEIGRLKAKIQGLSEQYVNEVLAAGGVGPDKPESGVAYAATLERQLVADRIAGSGLESKISALDRQRTQFDERLRRAPKQSAEIAQLRRARASAEQLYSYLEQRLNEAQLAEESETGSLRLLRQADVPLKPVSPRPRRIYPLTAFVALLLSLGAAVISTRLDRRLYTPADVIDKGFRLLGVVPNMKNLLRQTFGRTRTVEVRGRSVSSNMIALLMPNSAAAEAYRHIFARLRREPGAASIKTIIVTSPEAGVGKSTTAINLALTFASARLRTLIIDVDMRKPAVETYLGISSGLTLQSVLDLPDTSDIVPFVDERSPTGIRNLHAITVGDPIRNPLEHLVSPRLRKVTELLKQKFDVIIFDAPPLLVTSDAALLAPLCDATIVVVAAGESDSTALKQIENELQECKANFIGVVFNRFDSTDRMYKNTYGYLERNYGAYYGRAAAN